MVSNTHSTAPDDHEINLSQYTDSASNAQNNIVSHKLNISFIKNEYITNW